ncbi:piggyBac transposable element-derived protein 3-like [Dermacentor andersoni]|uniref:piggyBac transposable element-derived protein 3-like n=1 Tax=Dermacentor andersoni TaxID=34620 RepID=UPI0024176F83|nr:piggyBac transposable element-derived protein 3-like [Dermacentor andersoni]
MYGDNLIEDPPNTPEDVGESGKVVLRLTHDCPPGTEVFFDNFFASIELLNEMKMRGLGAAATIRKTRCGNCPLKTEKELKKAERGSLDFRSEKSTGIVICAWNDNRTVTAALNIHSIEPFDTCRRYDRKTKTYVDVQRPNIIRVYNQSMGGVDKADMLLSFYRNDMKTKKWYKRICFHLIDLAVVNAFLLYREAKSADMQVVDFKFRVALGLMRSLEGMPGLNRDGDDPVPATVVSPTSSLKASGSAAGVVSKRAHHVEHSVRHDNVGHWPVKVAQKNARMCKLSSCTKRTRFFCKKCSVYLCVDAQKINCFEKFHAS